MKLYYITFRSVTHAQKGERALGNAGIRCTLLRTPRWMEEMGCGYCLRLDQEDGAAAVQLLRRFKIPMRKIYLQGENGQMEEVSL
jgi:hypothetical protein